MKISRSDAVAALIFWNFFLAFCALLGTSIYTGQVPEAHIAAVCAAVCLVFTVLLLAVGEE